MYGLKFGDDRCWCSRTEELRLRSSVCIHEIFDILREQGRNIIFNMVFPPEIRRFNEILKYPFTLITYVMITV